MGYVALIRLELSKDDVRQPGDPIPEAAEWRNVETYIQCGHVALVPDGTESEVGELLRNGVVPNLGLTSRTKLVHLINAARRTQPVGRPLKAQPSEPAPAPPEPVASDDDDTVEYSETELMRMKRWDLEQIAKSVGVENPEEFKNRGQLVEAILEAAD